MLAFFKIIDEDIKKLQITKHSLPLGPQLQPSRQAEHVLFLSNKPKISKPFPLVTWSLSVGRVENRASKYNILG